MELHRFDGKCAFVTGAASGMGQATAIRLAREGASLYLTDLNEDGLAKTKANCEEYGVKVVTRTLNVTDEAAATAAIEECVAQLGKLDVLCNIAGVLVMEHFTKTTTDQLRLVLDVNVMGPFVLCRAAMPHLLESGGNIVNTASMSAEAGLAYGTAYSASKGGISALTRSLAVEYGGKGVRSNVVIPGSIATPMAAGTKVQEDFDFNLMARGFPLAGAEAAGTPDQIASVIAMVASDDGAYMNGSKVIVDGGAIA